MKGIAHFCLGVAVASCFPQAVAAGAAGDPSFFIVGGAFGLLPDTIDFKAIRFLFRHDVEVAPDPCAFDPQLIADALAAAVHQASETGQPVRIQLDTVRLGADAWLQYTVTFDTAKRSIRVVRGPVVDTGKNPLPVVSGQEAGEEAAAPLLCEVQLDYLATTTVDIFDGPLFEMQPAGRSVKASFIPWHRQASHSLVMAALGGLLVGVCWRPMDGAIAFLAAAAHSLADQLGYLGASLLYPLRRRRSQGLKLMHADHPGYNLTAVWLACIVTFWNLYQAEKWVLPPLNFWRLLFYAGILPFLAGFLVRRFLAAGASRDG